MARFFAIPTTAGLRKIANATLLGEKVNVVEFAVGDGAGSYYAPSADQTELRNETWRTDLSHGETDPDKPNVLNFYAVMPYNVGGFTIREMAVVDAAGDLIGVANTPDIEKVAFEDGVTNDMLLTISLAIESPETLEFKVDPNVVVASQADIARHNTSTEAHGDIRQAVVDAAAAATDASEAALDAHNKATDTHADIRKALADAADAGNASLTAHTSDASNPHKVTAAQAGALAANGKAVDAAKLNGQEASHYATAANLTAHTGSTSNPHKVTAAQAGALAANGKAVDAAKLNGQEASHYATAANLTAHTGSTSNPHKVTAAQAGALAANGKAVDAAKLNGQEASYYATAANLTAHTGSTSNPHKVTAAQAGAYTKAEIDAALANKANKEVPDKITITTFGSGFKSASTAASFYQKSDIKLVSVAFSIVRTSGYFPEGVSTLFTLPAGYRPATGFHFLGVAVTGNDSVGGIAVQCAAETNGVVRCTIRGGAQIQEAGGFLQFFTV